MRRKRRKHSSGQTAAPKDGSRSAQRDSHTSTPARPRASPPVQARPPLSRRKATLFAAITLAFPLIIIGALESGLRIGNYGGDTSAFDRPDVLRGLYMTPGRNVGRRYFPQERLPPSPPDDAFLVNKPAHSMRIFVLGESSAAGFPYHANGTFAGVLRDALTDVLPGDTVEVVNMGIAATNSYTIADLAGEVIDQRPDAIIIYGGHNEYYGALGAGSTETLGSFPAFVRLYLTLQRLKTFVLLRNTTTAVLAAVRGGRSTRDIEADVTRMESVVADQNITLGGDTYKRGVQQYESNLRVAIGAFRRAGIPVFVGSTPSNLRHQSPFGVAAIPPSTRATSVFDSASAILASGDSVRALAFFARARDLDVIRFRAPSEFEDVLKRVATETGSAYVPVAEQIAAASDKGIPGADLFHEHVHLNQRGYLLLAQAYFDALRSVAFLGRRAELQRFAGWDAYERGMRLTEVDHRVALHAVKTVTTRWPFVPVARQTDYRGAYRATDFIDSLAFTVSRGGMPWAQAKVMLGERHASAGAIDSAIAEYEGLIRDNPHIEVAYRLAARALMSANQPERAREYLERAYSIAPSAFTAFGLGVLAREKKDTDRAIALLEQALLLSPDMPGALYQLSVAYATKRDVGRARALAVRLSQVEPRYAGLGEWMSALGLPPP